MNRIKSLSVLLVLGTIFFACSGGNKDPMGIDQQDNELTEGRLTVSGDGPNTVVSTSNADSASQIINEAALLAFQKAAYAFDVRPSLVEPVRMDGSYNGYAVVDGSAEKVGGINNYNLKATFYDYSDDGSVYIGGILQFQGSMDKQGITKDIHVDDEIKFAGPYSGSMEYNNFRIPIDNMGNIISIFAPCEVIAEIECEGTITFRSGSNDIIKNPYPIVVNVILVPLPNGEEEEIYICDPDYSQ